MLWKQAKHPAIWSQCAATPQVSPYRQSGLVSDRNARKSHRTFSSIET